MTLLYWQGCYFYRVAQLPELDQHYVKNGTRALQMIGRYPYERV